MIHGAANSASVWTFWQRELAAPGWASYAVDLRGHGGSVPFDLSRTSMADYISDVEGVIAQLARPPVIVGWSMGAVIAMMVAARGSVAACVALEPSPLARKHNPQAVLREGVFGGEEYGLSSTSPNDQSAMPDLDVEERQIALDSLCNESRYARDERRHVGIVIESMPCPLLMVNGPYRRREDPHRWDKFWLKCDFMHPDEGSHWGLVLNRRLLPTLVPEVCAWMEQATRHPSTTTR
jgi:pimeloyl-ACP methyl ester carboxylesterase